MVVVAGDCSISERTNRQIEFYLFVRRREEPVVVFVRSSPLVHAAKFRSLSPTAPIYTESLYARVARKGKRISHLPTPRARGKWAWTDSIYKMEEPKCKDVCQQEHI